MITLPAFELLKRQPNPPHVARTLVTKDIPNEYGTAITYSIRVNRKGTEWWISASLDGLRMSNTLHTTSAQRAETWKAAIKQSKIRVLDACTTTTT